MRPREPWKRCFAGVGTSDFEGLGRFVWALEIDIVTDANLQLYFARFSHPAWVESTPNPRTENT